MFTIETVHPGHEVSFALRLVGLSSRAWTGYNRNSDSWRHRYYGELVKDRRCRRFFGIITTGDGSDVSTTDIGFVSILCVRPAVAKLQLQGKMDQYSYGAAQLQLRTSGGVTYHYIQSLFLDADFRQSRGALKHLRQAVLDLLKWQHAGLNGRGFVLYAEAGYDQGAKISSSHGFEHLQTPSFHGRDLFLLDSRHPKNDAAVRSVDTIRLHTNSA